MVNALREMVHGGPIPNGVNCVKMSGAWVLSAKTNTAEVLDASRELGDHRVVVLDPYGVVSTQHTEPRVLATLYKEGWL